MIGKITSLRRGVWSPLLIIFLPALALSGCVAADPPSYESGIILAASPADQPGENSGGGAIAGMVVLGAAGGTVGAGAGKALAIAGGIIAGEAAGSAAEAAGQKHDGIAYTIQFDNGHVVTLIEHLNAGDKVFGVGAMVTVETSGDEQRVLARQPA